jgi:hypothetical protein
MTIQNGTLRLALLLLALLAVASCASSPRVTSDFDPAVDFSQYRSFAFHDPLAAESDGYATPASQRMRQAARREMEARGYVHDIDNPDLWVNINAYMSERSEVFSTSTLQQRLYYDYVARGYVAVPYWSDRTDVHHYVEGTLHVDLVDVGERRLVWEGVAVGRTGRQTPAERAERIDQTMAEIFAEYPHRAR